MFNTSVALYRKTLKRIRPINVATHWLVTSVFIPLLERVKNFNTVSDAPFWFRLELLTDRHEKETLNLVKQMVKPGMVVLDIGAHVGYYARHFSRLVGPQGQIFAFEPHPRTYTVLNNNLSKAKNVNCIQMAVSDEEGTAELFDYLMMSASGSLHYDEALVKVQKAQLAESDIAPRIANDFPVQKFTVQTRPMDDFLAEKGISQVDFVKMDIEGAEMRALRGMKSIISNSPNIALIMEYNPHALKAFDVGPEQAIKEALAMGFNKVQAIETNGTLTDFTDNPDLVSSRTEKLMSNMGVVNLLFTKSRFS